jgi:hypothetical protein
MSSRHEERQVAGRQLPRSAHGLDELDESHGDGEPEIVVLVLAAIEAQGGAPEPRAPYGQPWLAALVLQIWQLGTTMPPMVTVTLKLDENMAAWLRREAKRLGRPTSALVREAIDRLRDSQGDGSVLSLIDDTVGSVASGVADLATDKRHLRGFGGDAARKRTKAHGASRP